MRALHRGGVALGVAAALAAPSAAAATTTTTTFSMPSEHAFVVPPGVTSLQLSLVGGHGGDSSTGALGGAAATEMATLAVLPGEILYAEVGGNGGNGDTLGNALGGTNGGGAGGSTAFGGLSGAGGGGASDVRTLSASSAGSLASRLVVAGGGGGGGGGGLFGGGAGGNGGASDANGFDGAPDTYHHAIGAAGARGTPSVGGVAGSGTSVAPNAATPGVLGIGGDAGGEDLGGGGGGGGGGIYGGGGGGDGTGQYFSSPSPGYIVGSGGGGGGGGASSIPPGPSGVSNLSLIPTATGAAPQITFTWAIPPPTATTTAPFEITAHTATLTGTVNPNASPITGCYFSITPAPPSGPTISCAQQLQTGATPTAASAQLAGLRPSTQYTVRLVASNAQGPSIGVPVRFTTWPPPPSVSQLTVAKTVHRGGARHPKQVKVGLHLNQRSKVLVQFARYQHHRWITLTYVLAPTLGAGTDAVRFSSGRLGLGRYRMYVSAINAFGEISGVQRAPFSIVR